MVLKHFVKSLDFRLQCWVWKKRKQISWHSNYYHTKTSPLHGLLEEKEIAVTLKPLKITNVQVWEKMKLHGT